MLRESMVKDPCALPTVLVEGANTMLTGVVGGGVCPPQCHVKQ